MRTILLAAAAALALTGCGKGAHVSSIGPNGSMTIKGANGDVAHISKALPSDLPAFVKVYPGGQVTSSLDTPGKGGILGYTVAAQPEQVMDFYKKLAADNKLTAQMDSASFSQNSGSGAHVIVFGGQNGDKRSLTATVETENGATKVALAYGMA